MTAQEVLKLLRIDGDVLHDYVKKGVIKKVKNSKGELSYDKDSVFDLLCTPLVKGSSAPLNLSELDTTFDFGLSDKLNWWEVPLGINEDTGEPYIWQVYDTNNPSKLISANCVINGLQRCGKTNIMNVIAAHLLNKRKETKIELYFADAYGLQFADYDQLSGVRCSTVGTTDLRTLCKELERKIIMRFNWLKEQRLTAIPLDSEEFPPIFVFIDDYEEVISSENPFDLCNDKPVDRTAFGEIAKSTDTLAKVAHIVNMHIVISANGFLLSSWDLRRKELYTERIICNNVSRAVYEQTYDLVPDPDAPYTEDWIIGKCVGGSVGRLEKFDSFHVTRDVILQLEPRNTAIPNKTELYIDVINNEHKNDENEDGRIP